MDDPIFKYLIVCKFCGAILFKTKEIFVGILNIEIKCPNPHCKKLLKLPEDIIVNLEKKKVGRS